MPGRARDHLISAQSTVRCSTNWAIAGMACAHRLHLAFLQSFFSQMLYQLSYSRNGLCPQATSSLFAIVCCTGVQHWENGGRDDLERFFEQEQFNKIGVEKPPKSSRPDFPKYCPPKPSADSGMDRQDTKADKQHSWNAACAGARSSQGPSDFCTVYSQMLYQLSYSRNGLCPQATSSLFAIFFQSDALPTEL